MADPKIRIPIEMPAGDLSGVDKGLEQIDRMVSEIEQMVSEVDRAQDALGDQVPGIKDAFKEGFDKLFDQQRLQGVGEQLRGLAQEAGAFARSFAQSDAGRGMLDGLSEEFKVFGGTALEISQGVAQGFAQGGPIGAAIGGLTGLIRSAGGEWLDSNRRILESEAELAAAVAAHEQKLRDRKAAAVQQEIKSTYAAEREELEGQLRALQQLTDLRREQQKLAAAQDKLADAQDRAAGRPEAAIQAENIGQKLNAEIEAIQQQIADKEAELQIQSDNLSAAADAYARQVQELGEQAAEKTDEARAYNQQLKDLQVNEEAFAALKERLATTAQTAITEAETAYTERSASLLDGLEATAAKFQGELQAEIDKSGSNASREAKAALESVRQIMEDGAVKPDEVQKLASAFSLFKNSRSAADKEIMKGFEDVTKNTDEVLSALRSSKETIDRQGEQIRQLRADFERLSAER